MEKVMKHINLICVLVVLVATIDYGLGALGLPIIGRIPLIGQLFGIVALVAAGYMIYMKIAKKTCCCCEAAKSAETPAKK